MDINKLSAYELIEKHHSEDLKSEAYVLEHKKSGARIAVLENDDENKVFYIGFRTPPKDSTGVAHIIEHSVLCGSKRYPLKDPFVELVKTSMNTFLNAMTYPDKTVYPVASCNDQDFKNLMGVYMDAVLEPNIYKEEKIFRQEGWHYELEDADGELKINGVVYNEMKGAFSSPDDVLSRETFSSLYPDTAYGVESGGDPEVIPELTYEAFLDFHKKYYHPVNSYIYLYGNADMAERLEWMDKEYLSKYDRIDIDSFPGEQAAFEKPLEIEKEYPITEDEKEENNTYLTYNSVIGKSTDRELYTAFQMVDYALISADGTPLWKALVDAGIGTEVYATYENGIYQPFYSIVAKNANAEDHDRFVSIVEDTLKKVAEEGFSEDALTACLNSMEFRYREGDTGRFPKGLLYGLTALDNWLYDKDEPFKHIEQLDTYRKLREKIGSSYYTDLVKKYLIDNPHKTILTLKPKKGLTSVKDKALADKLAAYKASLSKEQTEEIVRKTAELKAFQEAEDPKEAYECLPKLKLSDMKKTEPPFINEERSIDGIKTYYHNVETNGILYAAIYFDMSSLPYELYPYANVLSHVFRGVDTEKHKFEQLGYEIDKYTGSMAMVPLVFPMYDTVDRFARYFALHISVLNENAHKGMELAKEIIGSSKLDDRKRLKEIIAEGRSRMQGAAMSAGHMVASGRALSYDSEYALAKEYLSGLKQFEFLTDMEKNFDEKADELIAKLKETAEIIFTKAGMVLDVTGNSETYDIFAKEVSEFIKDMKDKPEATEVKPLVPEKLNEGLTNSAQIQYVCRAGNFARHGLKYNGALRVLRTILGYDYLWTNVRVKGGAYGCMSAFMPDGQCYFVSYRDPNLEATVDVFEKAAEYVENFDADEEKMSGYIIGTMSELDMPLTPRSQGARSFMAAMTGRTIEDAQKVRDEILGAKTEDIRALAEYVRAFMSDELYCVVGNEDKIKAASDSFGSVKGLFE
ncbi:MAG: insulinase family protein [Lachnospiraceae bacterium]|nr:insulinase family protein [Lachnospiraceae bacterium]